MSNWRSFLATAILLVVTFSDARAQDCEKIVAVAGMARTKSAQALTEVSKRAGESYQASLVFAYRSFQLNPGNKDAAERLLALVPRDGAQQTLVMTLGDSLCNEESSADMRILARVSDGLPLELARAVLLARQFFPAYVRYSMEAVLNPHSDYAVQMKRVCRQAQAEFVRAVTQLPKDLQPEFSKHVMNPTSCTVLAVPEAEQ